MIINNVFVLSAIADSCYLCATGKNYRHMIRLNDKIMENPNKNIKFNKSEIHLAKLATGYALTHIKSYCKSNNANGTSFGKRIAITYLKLAIKTLNKKNKFYFN